LKDIIYYCSLLSPLLAIWTGRRLRISLWYYALACFVADILSFFLKRIGSSHSIVSNLFILVEFLLVTYFFKTSLWGEKYRKPYWLVVGILSAFFIVGSVFKEISATISYQAYNYIEASMFYFIYILLSLLGFYKIMKEASIGRLEQSPLFFACVAFLLYASGTFLIFLFNDLATAHDRNLYASIWIYFFRPLNIIKNVLLAYCLRNVATGIQSRTEKAAYY
jgi:hypothetical protein